MKTKKFKGYIISDKKPEAGDTVICIQRKNFNYGATSKVSRVDIPLDTVNWKVIVLDEERRQELVDEVIKELKKDIDLGDYTVLFELLKFIPI